MKILLFLLLPLFGMGQITPGKYVITPKVTTVPTTDEIHVGSGEWIRVGDSFYDKRYDTIPATILVQYSYHDAITVRDVYLINGEPWVKQREKWVKVKAYRWKLSNGWSK